MQTATTATEALRRYQDFLSRGALIQSTPHLVDADGRQLACALGILGDHVHSARDCPATVMPLWLAQMVPYFFDLQSHDAALAWGAAFYAELARLGGKVPFSVIHDWHATVVTPMAIEVSEKRKRNPETHRTLQALHRRAVAGETIARDDWYAALNPALFDTYANAYAYPKFDAAADAKEFANAYANANSYADFSAYADANVKAYAYCEVNADANVNRIAAIQIAIKHQADGMIECLRRVTKTEL